MTALRPLAAATLALSLLAAPAVARTVEGFDFPETTTAGGAGAALVGTGVRVKWMVNVYAMGVYQKTPTKSAGHLVNADEPKVLWLHMLRGISGDKMRDAIDDGLESNTSEATRGALAADIDALKKAFPNEIGKGLDIKFEYAPGRGVTLKIGASEKLTVNKKEFMVAMWSIWFGRSPADKDLKGSVLAP